jgi:formylglycine-generating enzyme required for sulfatase activity
MKNSLIILIIFLFLIISTAACAKQNRIALVIGNSLYKDAPLKNPVNDAADMAKTLSKMGFKVDKLLNARRRDMKKAISQFGNKLHQENTIGLFYFAGHGVQVDGSNFLLPIGAEVESEADIEFEAINAGRILSQMSRAGNGLNMVILDACRNNPFARSFRSSTRGLARMDAPKGSLILYATSPGDVAADGSGRNGLFTEKLMHHINQPGLKIEDVFKQTAISVSQQSRQKQVPYIEGVILGDFYFQPKKKTAEIVKKEPAKEKKKKTENAEHRFWDAVIQDPGKDMLLAYLEQYPNGHYTSIANIKLKKLKAQPQQMTQKAVSSLLKIRSNLDKNSIRINGEFKGSTPLDINLKPGIYAVEVHKHGFKSWERTVEIKSSVKDLMVYAKLNPQLAAKKGFINTSEPINKHSSNNPYDLEFVKVVPGCFQMGSEDGDSNEEPVHKVCISSPYLIGKYEVTQKQWFAVKKSKPSYFKNCDTCPVERVSWHDTQTFIKKLNSLGPEKYRLPTEAEWEYACRAGNIDYTYCGSNSVDDVWYKKNSSRTNKVGLKKANAVGAHDMSGNVWEWVNDWYDSDYYEASAETDPKGPMKGSKKVKRGGGWYFSQGYGYHKQDFLQNNSPGRKEVRATIRKGEDPDSKQDDLGFRLVKVSE